MITKPSSLCVWLEEFQELGREKALNISQQVETWMKNETTFPVNKFHLWLKFCWEQEGGVLR